MNILAIETSFDETAAAVVKDGTEVVSSTIATSKDFHDKYGGVLPDLAARKQLDFILPVITAALKPLSSPTATNSELLSSNQIDAIAVTIGPGLIGSLLIGVEAAKTIAYATGRPLIPVNHVLAHMYANFLSLPQITNHKPMVNFPAISLVASGAHTELFLMKSINNLVWLGGSLDDAAGECFDKTARLLGFGMRGGIAIQESAGNYKLPVTDYKPTLPRPLIRDNSFNFSFSGLKTAVLREVSKLKSQQQLNNITIQQLSYEVQEAITDVLVKKTLEAAQTYDVKSIMISGGVAANTRLRQKLAAAKGQFKLHIPPPAFCTDNASYIGAYAYFRGKPAIWQEVTAIPDLSVEIPE